MRVCQIIHLTHPLYFNPVLSMFYFRLFYFLTNLRMPTGVLTI